ncbi:MAG TPA: hypothetical protein DDW18_04140 [Firmicutes bacterium]|nr:hypothetical protein [Bacillota bacterium]HBN00096.1 hypothetical protein [Bacillota bacterium]
MKKLVSILVSAISLLAIVLVAIFGTKPQGITPIIYIDSIKILPSDNSEYKEEDGKPSMLLVYDEMQEPDYGNGKENYMPYIFKTEILPENATNRSFTYFVDENSKAYIDFPPDNEGASSKGMFLVKKVTNKAYALVRIFCKPQDGGKAQIAELEVVIDYRSVQSESAKNN